MYLNIYISICILAYFEIFKGFKSKFFLRILIIFLTFFCGFRYNNGVDYNNYFLIFKNLEKINSFYYLEIGFRIIIVLIKNLFDKINPYDFFWIFSIINFYFFYKAIKKEKYPIFVTTLYFSTFYLPYNFNAMRQSINLSLFMLFINYNLDQKKIKSLLYFFLALIFHYSAFIYFPIVYFFKSKRVKKINIVIIIFMFIFCLLISKQLMLLLGLFVKKINFFNQNFKNAVGGLAFLQRIIYFFILSYWLKKMKDSKFQILYKIYSVGFIIYALLSSNNIFAARINMGFRILEILMIPMIFSYMKNDIKKKMFFILLVVLYLLPLLKDIEMDYYSPYRFNNYFNLIWKLD